MLDEKHDQSTTTEQTSVEDYAKLLASLPGGDQAAIKAAVRAMHDEHARQQPDAAPVKFTYSEVIHNLDTLDRREDEEVRSDPHLRLEAVTLVEGLADALADAAGRLAVARDDNNPWGEDKARADLLWQLSEFLCLAEWSREDRADNLLQQWQLDGERGRRYAADWFRVDIMSDDRLEAQPVEAS
jgi:hypothetical protein